MTNTTIKIVSDGTAFGTKVFIDGKELTGIAEIVIDPIVPNGVVTARITVLVNELQLSLSDAAINCDDPELNAHIRDALLKEAKP